METSQDLVLQCGQCGQQYDKIDEFTGHKCCLSGDENIQKDTSVDAEGPISVLLPSKFHRFVSKSILRSYVCETEENADYFRKRADPADIPVIVFNKKKDVYKEVMTNLNERGREAVAAVNRPWLINLLVDWCQFDRIICSFTETADSGDSYPSTSTSTSARDSQVPDDADSYSSTARRQTWCRETILKLIELRTENEDLFVKPGIKKKTVWENIAKKISEGDQRFSGTQCEQKWKNITKQYRDTVDHNNKSGNEPKECPFFKELSEAYGYRPNVKPLYLKGSMPSGSDQNNNETGDSNSSESSTSTSQSSACKRKTTKMMEQRKRKKTEENPVMNFLEDMHKEMKEGQTAVLNQLKKQHKEKMKTEDAKLNLMARLVDKITEKK